MESINIQAFTLKMSLQDIKSQIPEGIIENIKKQGENPYFQAYSVIHEGVSKPKIIGEGYVKIAWPKQAVNTVKGLIKKGLQFFVGHNKDNSTNGRRSVGEVIADFQKEIKGKLHHIVIGHFPDKQSASKYDVCSIEADVAFQKVDNVSFAEKVYNITGIALGSSNTDSPAFPGAVRLATLQAFEEEENTLQKKKEGDSKMTFEEIKKTVKDMNIWPHQLYAREDMVGDHVFGKLLDKADTLETELTATKKIIADKDNEIVSLNKKASLGDVQDLFKTLIPEGATDKQKEFYKKNFNPEKMEDISEKGVKDFLEKSEKDYQDMASIFGVKNETVPPQNPGSDEQSSDETEEERLDRLTEASMS